jgi:xylose isomerase
MKSKTKMKAELFQFGTLSFLMFSVGVSVGERTSHASAIYLIATFAAIFCMAFGAKYQMQNIQDSVAEKIDALRYRGFYPPKGKGSNEDVKRLKEIGEKMLAMRLYLELHAVPLKEAKQAVDAL